MHAAVVDLRLDHIDAEIRCGAHGLGALASGEQGFRGDAAIVEAVAAHASLLDQDHRHAELGRCRRDGQTPGARADDAKVGRQHLFHSRLIPLSHTFQFDVRLNHLTPTGTSATKPNATSPTISSGVKSAPGSSVYGQDSWPPGPILARQDWWAAC